MSIAQWGWPRLLRFWLASLVVAAGLLLIQYQRARPVRFFWLVPYPSSFRALCSMVGTVFRELPLVGVALLAIPAVVVLVTVYWAVQRLV